MLRRSHRTDSGFTQVIGQREFKGLRYRDTGGPYINSYRILTDSGVIDRVFDRVIVMPG